MKKLELANLPTKIEFLENLSSEVGKNIYIKRDDYTGVELTGNKIRKLEYILKDAQDQGADTIITCGAIQSNHARATVYAARKLGMDTKLVLAGSSEENIEGNRFLDLLAGAQIKFVSHEDYDNSRDEIMEEIAEDVRKEGKTPYIIPQGASNSLGSLGYVEAYKEIVKQQKELGVKFDAIVVTVGSAGTFAGLQYGMEISEEKIPILGFSISAPGSYTEKKILPDLFKGMNELTGDDVQVKNISINEDYIGNGYAKSRIDELEFIRDFVRREGIILDPVYTGKALYGLVSEVTSGKLKEYENILFLHTGGAFGWAGDKIEMLLK